MSRWTERIRRLFGYKEQSKQSNQEMSMVLTPEIMQSMVKGVMTTRADELDCEECFVALDQFAELYLVGNSASDALPLVQDHLDRCRDCRQEFELLLLALQVP